MSSHDIVRIPPYHYIHVLDQNSNISRLETGPQTFLRQNNEKMTLGTTKFLTVPVSHYCIIENPVLRDADTKQVVYDTWGQAKLRLADVELRFSQDSFPLYPGEVIKQPISPLQIIQAGQALRVRALLDFVDKESGTKHLAGDEWLFIGPGTYVPRKEAVVDELVKSIVIRPNKALHLCALRSHVDTYGKKRLNGEEWLVTFEDTESHMPNVNEVVVGIVELTTLSSRQYVVIEDPVDEDGRPQLGKMKLLRGNCDIN
jgi:major vault protein